MRAIGIKDLYKNLATEIKDLPFGVTVRGKLVGVMVSPQVVAGLDKSPVISLDVGAGRQIRLDKAERSEPSPPTFRPYSKAAQLGKKGTTGAR